MACSSSETFLPYEEFKKDIGEMVDTTSKANAAASLLFDDIKEYENDTEFWGQFRGDYLDLRDYLMKETLEEKKELILQWTKSRVTLMREHILMIWTFNHTLRDELTQELLMLNEIIYGE